MRLENFEILSQSDSVGAKFEQAAITPKRYEIGCQLLLVTNRKSHTGIISRCKYVESISFYQIFYIYECGSIVMRL